ncbi:hypothetical protein TCAL_03271 [Tigriopus californicus]|uniref:Uncharacterized protein n=1 Tax=Tigriopus californicus TaxID=6832 RepID=A0A553NU68_TIGCA|nr:hypothetical protein TCAL_03271 [Tigriopus californicus]
MSNATKDAPKAEKDTKVSAKDTPDLGLLEEDDDFEEFPTEGKLEVLVKYSRKRPHSHSPPLRSPEPLAKKVCTRVSPMQEDPPPRTPPSSRRSNGHASTTPPNTNTPTSAEQQQPAQRNGRSSSRSGNARNSRTRSSSSSTNETPDSPARATRSSARLRSSRK